MKLQDVPTPLDHHEITDHYSISQSVHDLGDFFNLYR